MCNKTNAETHHESVVVAEHVCLLAQGHHAVKVCDYKDGGRKSHHGADQHAAPQSTVEDLLTHQQWQLEQQCISPGQRTKWKRTYWHGLNNMLTDMSIFLCGRPVLWLVMSYQFIQIKIIYYFKIEVLFRQYAILKCKISPKKHWVLAAHSVTDTSIEICKSKLMFSCQCSS